MIRLLLLIGLTALIAWLNWRLATAQLDRSMRKASTPLRDDRLGPLIDRLARTAGVDRIEPRVFEMPAVNGMAAPDGAVYVSSGLMEKLRAGLVSPEEAASVIAHEMGHVALGHHRRRVIDLTGSGAARMALGLALSRIIPIVGFHIANFLAALFMAKLSRGDEIEADRYATALMIRAGLGAGPQASLLRKLEKMSSGAAPPVWLSTHPDVASRVAAIEENAAHWGEEG